MPVLGSDDDTIFAIASISETLGIMTIMPLIAVITNQQEIPMISLLIEFLQVMWPETDATLIVFEFLFLEYFWLSFLGLLQFFTNSEFLTGCCRYSK